jgi:hypothetical protein
MANIRIVQGARISLNVALGHNFSTFNLIIDVLHPELKEVP